MITKANVMIKTGTVLALIGFVWASGVMAQTEKTIETMARPVDDAASCKEMNWNEEFSTAYPWATEACHTVVVVNGEKWARFEGKFKRSNSDGSFDTEFLSRSNRELGRVTLMPTPEQRAHIDNEDVRFSDLDRDQILSFYVPERAVGFAVEPGEPQTQFVRIVDSTDEPRNAEQDSAKEQPVLLAQADTRDDRRESVLPDTAGPLPLFALGGLVSLLGGLGLTLRRKASTRTV